MTPRFQKNYLTVDLLLQSLLVWPTLFSIFIPVFSLFGLFLVGLVQMSSALLGALLLRSRLRAIYFGTAACFLGLSYALFSISLIPNSKAWIAWIPMLLISVIAGGWYYALTVREWQQTREVHGYV
jgi:hypothetical protein